MTSYFDTNFDRVRINASIPGSEAGPLVSFLTITDLANLLYGEDTNLATGISGDFMDDVIRVDLNKVINSLRAYNGAQRKGIREAQRNAEDALRTLYEAIAADRKGNANQKVKALLVCRNNLQAAYHHLEHWK